MDNLTFDNWLRKITKDLKPHEHETIKRAVTLAKIAFDNDPKKTIKNLVAAEILHKLHLDSTTLAAAILYSTIRRSGLTLLNITKHLGEQIAKLVHGAEQMSGIAEIYHDLSNNPNYKSNINNIRKMFLAMVDDIRVVLIKLAEHLATLRSARILPPQIKNRLATETMTIYAPLTNRLGIAQLKWELEDLAFQYSQPERYNQIGLALEKEFPESAKYIEEVSQELKAVLLKTKIKDFRITGRTKHVYSIYRKINRKKIGLHEIYDISALRILVSSIKDCYQALSAIHTTWQYIPHEFDDYIASPKPNRYRSIHTAVLGPKNRSVEIQIRTFDMHREAELGVAAHWVYKEGKQEANYQAKLSWLREVMDWQQEITQDEKTPINLQQIFNDYVYVFTPQGDILELPKGATPLDFAYYLHSELGHRCSGAKINNKLVPLTSKLKTGDRVEILTSRNGKPSRDWLISGLGFLNTVRARSKVHQWFKKQSKEHNTIQGQNLLDRELKKLHLNRINIKPAISKLRFKTSDDLLVALGSGDLKINTLLNALEIETEKSTTKTPLEIISSRIAKESYTSDINIEGINNLLTHTANCCKPIPGEEIVGYVTLGRGIAIHRIDCINLIHSVKLHPERLIPVSWGKSTKQKYPVDMVINAFNRQNLSREVKNILTEYEIKFTRFSTTTNKKPQTVKINLTIEIPDIGLFSDILNKIGGLTGVIKIYRSN